MFFAIAQLGAVATCMNCWVTADVMQHCITSTNCKVVVVDSERAKLLSPLLPKIQAGGCGTVLVVRSKEIPAGMTDYATAVARFAGNNSLPKIDILPEDNAVIFFTSGSVPFFER